MTKNTSKQHSIKQTKLWRLALIGALALATVAASLSGRLATADEPVSNKSLVAGTTVSTESGARAIETLKAGDLIWVEDEEHGQLELKAVTELAEQQTSNTLLLAFSNGEQIETTPTHSFYVQEVGFKTASQLAAGDLLVSKIGPSLAIASVIPKSQSKTVYSLSVAEFHTYFVSGSSLWVHD